jgi:hypothetical protein
MNFFRSLCVFFHVVHRQWIGARKGTEKRMHAFDVRCSGDVMIFNKNSSSLIPRKKSNKINTREGKTLKNSEERKKGKKERRRKESKEILDDFERDFSDSHFTRLAPWRSPERKERKTEKKSEQFLASFGCEKNEDSYLLFKDEFLHCFFCHHPERVRENCLFGKFFLRQKQR